MNDSKIQTATLEIETPQTPRGSACRYAWGCYRKTLVLRHEGRKYIVCATKRLLEWKSRNWSSQAQGMIDRFMADAGPEVAEFKADPVSWLLERKFTDTTPGARMARELRAEALECMRAEIYNRD